MRVIKCARCGKEIEAKGNGQKYCPECAYQARLERVHAFHDSLRAARESGVKPSKMTIAGTKHIKCAKCGADVIVSIRGGHAKYCPKCAQEAYAESHNRSREKNAKLMTAICNKCGKPFEYVYKWAYKTTCDECRGKRREGWRRKEKPEKKKLDPTIDEMIAAAKAKGMSYGQYKAWLYMQEQKKKA